MKFSINTAIFAMIFSLLSLESNSDQLKQTNILPKETREMLNLFSEAYAKTKREYVVDITDKQLIESAINGMLHSLDPHSGYMDKKAFEEMKQMIKGDFGGIGIEVTMEHGVVKVISPIEGTPGDKAGIQAGDYIVGINGEPVFGLNLNEAVEKMRGKPGTSLKITINREGVSEPIDMSITRDTIKTKVARSELFGDIAYIKINSFSEKTTESVKEEYEKMCSNSKKCNGVVVDLRNNPGGLLDQAVSVASLFINNGAIVSTKGRYIESEYKYEANSKDMTQGKPIVVLVNNGSASSSEIVAGALQDYERAVIMGTKTFGKGSVQSIISMSNGGAIKITTYRYYTPKGRSIQADGITPDIIVEQSKIEKIKPAKLNISESTLHKHLKNEFNKSSINEILEKDSKIGELYGKDFQLARAIDLLKGINTLKRHTNKVLENDNKN